MESAPKRRRTSPRTSVGIHPENDHTTAPPTTEQASTEEPSRSRPSFASPTKSSLARSNPEILERRQSSQRARSHASPTRPTSRAGDNSGDAPAEQTSRPPNLPKDTDASTAEPTMKAKPRRSRTGRELLDERARALREQEQAAETLPPASEPDREPDPDSIGTPSRDPTRRIGGGLGALPKRSPIKPIARPFPQTGDSPEEDINPFARRGLRRTPTKDQPVSDQNRNQSGDPGTAVEGEARAEAEPELPPTPQKEGQSDPVVSSPAEGIHNTPSKHIRRKHGDIMKPSPLKEPPLRPPELTEPIPYKGAAKRKAPSRDTGDDLVISVPEADPEGDAEERKGPHPARRISASDAHADRKALRDKLKAEAAQLEADLAFAAQENERLRQSNNRRRSARHGRPHRISNPSELVDVLKRHLLPHDVDSGPDVAQQLLDAALNPASWLSLDATSSSAALPDLMPKEDSEPTPMSHHPISMTAEEQLPFLQAFTPFTFTSTMSIFPKADSSVTEAPEPPLIRQHTITVSSASPPGLFAATVELRVDTSSLRIHSLRVPRLDPAAIAELQPFISHVCASSQRNASVLFWSMAEWYRVAVERARFWCVLAEEVNGDRERFAEMVRGVRASKRRKKRRKGGADGDADEEGEGQEALVAGRREKGFSRAAILAHMGRTSFDVAIPEDGVDDEAKWPRVRVQWKIDFDWTGEGFSKVGVLVGVPGKWREADDGGAIAGVRKVFADLTKGEKNPSAAVRTVIALLAGDMSTRS